VRILFISLKLLGNLGSIATVEINFPPVYEYMRIFFMLSFQLKCSFYVFFLFKNFRIWGKVIEKFENILSFFCLRKWTAFIYFEPLVVNLYRFWLAVAVNYNRILPGLSH